MIPKFTGKKQKYANSSNWEPKRSRPTRFNPGDIVAPKSQRRRPLSEWKLLRVLTCEPSYIVGEEVTWHFTYDPLVKLPESDQRTVFGFDYADYYFKLNTVERKKAMSIFGGIIVGNDTGIL